MTASTPNPSSIGSGQLEPENSNDETSVAMFIARQIIARLETMKLVKVIHVHGGGGAIAAAGTVDVQPLVSQIDGDGNSVQHGIVYGIPWWRLQGGSSAVIADPVVGDLGYVVCADRDSSSVRTAIANGQSPFVSPGSRRQFSISDGIYVGGCYNGVPTQYLVFTATGLKLVDLNGNVIQFSTTGITIDDLNGNIIQMKAGAVNVVTSSFQVNGTPITVP